MYTAKIVLFYKLRNHDFLDKKCVAHDFDPL